MDKALYQDRILDHYKHPRGRADLSGREDAEEGDNPNCGDRVRLALDLAGDRIEKAQFDGEGCAVCMASASILCETLAGRTRKDAKDLCGSFVQYMEENEPFDFVTAPDAEALSDVKAFPMRLTCAILPWRTCLRALDRF